MTTPVTHSDTHFAPSRQACAQFLVEGAVQGVGFRPYVYRLAESLELSGWVENSGQGVTIVVEGDQELVRVFSQRLPGEIPPQASITRLRQRPGTPRGLTGFEIRHSRDDGPKTARVIPDLATCPECERDIRDPDNRRFRYPFTNCTNCGPRYSIIEALPYDRPNTSMKQFRMCPECHAEYDNPCDRRFHAQPNACPACGPQLALWSRSGRLMSGREDALIGAANAIRAGLIVAVKGLGGFHLLADARSDDAVRRLRERKLRAEKPFALMYPTVDAVTSDCRLEELERRVLESAAAPIVLLRKLVRPQGRNSELVAPGNPWLGVMRPYTPLHLLLLGELQFPVVATSGNRSDEPIVTDEVEAVRRLGGIADLFLVHDRPIVRSVDDSVVTVMHGRELVLRCARGYAPLQLALAGELPPAIALGGHMKNSIAVGIGQHVWASQHIGDLESPEAFDSFRRTSDSLARLHEVTPVIVVCDQHPEYLSTKEAHLRSVPVHAFQHHHAHILSCLADNEADGPVLGIAWDGTGYGSDGTIWGGEFLEVNGAAFKRRATLHSFRLPGGDAAVREPRRTAIGVLAETFGPGWMKQTGWAPLAQFTDGELNTMGRMLERGINSPVTTSAGRLFDAVASLLGICQKASFEGQAAMMLEYALAAIHTDLSYPFAISTDEDTLGTPLLIVDWRPAVRALLQDHALGIARGEISAKFHNTLAEMAVTVVRRLGAGRVALSGGCFQNRYLTERLITRLEDSQIEVLWHRRIPPNDGGIAIGQLSGLAAKSAQSRPGGF